MYQTDGITVGGTRELLVRDATISRTWEGIDLTGDTSPNDHFEIRDSFIENIHSACYKFANTAQYGLVYNNVARQCGLMGYLVIGSRYTDIDVDGDGSADSIGLSRSTRDITFVNNKAINIGYPNHWRTPNYKEDKVVSGFTLGDDSDRVNIVGLKFSGNQVRWEADPQSNLRFDCGWLEYFGQAPGVEFYGAANTSHGNKMGQGPFGICRL